MKLRQSNPFTLIELLIVIGIIGILATVVIPSVGDALNDAKRTASQVACKTFEEDVTKYDAQKGSIIKKYATSLDATSMDEEIQADIYALLSGQSDLVGTVVTANTTTNGESGTYTVTPDGRKYYEPKISEGALGIDPASGNIWLASDADITADKGFAKNKFNNPFQFVKRYTDTDSGCIQVYHPTEGYIKLVGLKRGDSKLRVVCFDDSDPAKLLAKEGAYSIYNGKGTAASQIPEGEEVAGMFLKLEQ